MRQYTCNIRPPQRKAKAACVASGAPRMRHRKCLFSAGVAEVALLHAGKEPIRNEDSDVKAEVALGN